jgi:hypothetical protein
VYDRPDTPLHPGPAVGRPGAGPDFARQARADRPHRRRPVAGEPAQGLSLPHPVLEGAGALQDRGSAAGDASGRLRRHLRLSLRRAAGDRRDDGRRQQSDCSSTRASADHSDIADPAPAPVTIQDGCGRCPGPRTSPTARWISHASTPGPRTTPGPKAQPPAGISRPVARLRARSRRRRLSSRADRPVPARPLATKASRPHSCSSWVHPRGQSCVPGLQVGEVLDDPVGVDVGQPEGPDSGGVDHPPAAGSAQCDRRGGRMPPPSRSRR